MLVLFYVYVILCNET